jgi:hypothetical protein
VYDYRTGKQDWMGAGLPTEGTNTQHPRLADVVRRDMPVCSPGERLGEVRDRAVAAGWDACVVVSRERVVLGLLRAGELQGDPDLLVERVMRPRAEHVPAVRERRGDASHHDQPQPGKLAGHDLGRQDVGIR